MLWRFISIAIYLPFKKYYTYLIPLFHKRHMYWLFPATTPSLLAARSALCLLSSPAAPSVHQSLNLPVTTPPRPTLLRAQTTVLPTRIQTFPSSAAHPLLLSCPTVRLRTTPKDRPDGARTRWDQRSSQRGTNECCTGSPDHVHHHFPFHWISSTLPSTRPSQFWDLTGVLFLLLLLLFASFERGGEKNMLRLWLGWLFFHIEMEAFSGYANASSEWSDMVCSKRFAYALEKEHLLQYWASRQYKGFFWCGFLFLLLFSFRLRKLMTIDICYFSSHFEKATRVCCQPCVDIARKPAYVIYCFLLVSQIRWSWMDAISSCLTR